MATVIAVHRTPAALRAIWTLTCFLAFLGVAMAVRRMLHLFAPPSPAAVPGPVPDTGFSQHAVLTMIHIVPGALFMILAPLQFVRRLRHRRLRLHRILGRTVLGCGFVIGLSALVMSPQMAIGGANETAATYLFGSFFLFALARAFWAIRHRDVARHREWMIRAFAIGLAVATVRPIVGIFFATSRLTHLTPHDFFGTAFWLGFTMHLIAAEVWINYTRPVTARPGYSIIGS